MVHSLFTGKALAILLALAFVTACAQTPLVPTSTSQAEGTFLATPMNTAANTPVPEASATQPPLSTFTPTLTETPSPVASLPPVSLPLPSLTPTAEPPYLTILVDAPCQFGPGTDYLLKYGLHALNWMRAMGRNPDGTWLNIKSADDPLWNACWIQTEKVRFDRGSLRDLPVVSMIYPLSTLYQPPSTVSASREGNVVTISWQPVYMTEDDERGYFVEAWVCQGGKQVFVPVGLAATFNQNNNTDRMSLQVSDEPGCDVPSNARLYAVEKHGYTPYREIPWPAIEGTSTPPATPVPVGTPPADSGLPVVEIPRYTDCLYGPGAFFLYKTSLLAGSWMEVAGRSPDGAWLAVQDLHGWDPCWIPVAQTSFVPDSLDTIPVTYPTLPRSFWYRPPNPSAHRTGDIVTVSWEAIDVPEYDYRGYLVIAWVCLGGKQVYRPFNIVPSFAENAGRLSVTIQDEAGCSEASSAFIYTAEKRGYSGERILWPAH